MLTADSLDTITRFVPEVILAVIFGLFVLKLLDRQDKRDEQRDSSFLRALKERDTEWRSHMADDRNQHGAALGRIAEEVKQVATLAAQSNALISQHDAWARLEATRTAQQRSPVQ